jgi:hypothetical protein
MIRKTALAPSTLDRITRITTAIACAFTFRYR